MFLPMLRSWGPQLLTRRAVPIIAVVLALSSFYSFLGSGNSKSAKKLAAEAYYPEAFPLAWEYVHLARTQEGAWYIPPHWLHPTDPRPTTIIEAAHLAHKLATASGYTIPYTKIPLIIHQTWKDTKVNTWPRDLADGVENWLNYSMAGGNASMAYFFWLDDGCKQVIEEAESHILDMVEVLPMKVEKADIFRVVVLNWVGGIYGDVDTLPLRSPASWVDQSDISPWSDTKEGLEYGTTTFPTSSKSNPIQIILGIEGDNDPGSDTNWRMGYNFPVQLTQWALASAAQHPILKGLISNFAARMNELAEPYGGDMAALHGQAVLKKEDPLKLTGPEAITIAAMEWLDKSANLRWNALTGLEDGGRSKAVGDTLIYPITAFSPGRGVMGNMGSKPITHHDARVLHRAQGSWKKLDLTVEIGKLCRTLLGRCRDWSKVPG